MKPEEKIILTKSQILIVDISNSIDHYYRLMQTPLFNNEPISDCNLTFLHTYDYVVDDLDISFEGSSELRVDNTGRVYTYTANILYILSSNDGPRRYVGIYTKHNLSKLLSSAINSEQVKYILKYFTDNNIFTIVKDFTENDAGEDGEDTDISDIIEDALEYAYDVEFITRCGIKFTNSQNGYVRFKNRLWFLTVSKHNDPSDTESEYEYEYEILQLGDGPKSNEVLFSDIYNYDGTPKFKKVYDNTDGPIFHRFYFDNGRIIDTFSKHKAVDKFEGLENMFKDVDFDIVKIIMNNTEYDFEPRYKDKKEETIKTDSNVNISDDDRTEPDDSEPFEDKGYIYIVQAETKEPHKNCNCNYKYFAMTATPISQLDTIRNIGGREPVYGLIDCAERSSNFIPKFVFNGDFDNLIIVDNNYYIGAESYSKARILYVIDTSNNFKYAHAVINPIQTITDIRTLKTRVLFEGNNYDFEIIKDFTDKEEK